MNLEFDTYSKAIITDTYKRYRFTDNSYVYQYEIYYISKKTILRKYKDNYFHTTPEVLIINDILEFNEEEPLNSNIFKYYLLK